MQYSLHHLAKIALGITFLFSPAAHCFASDLSATGPQASAEQIIAAHGSADRTVLRLTFSESVDGAAAHPVLADIAETYVFVKRPDHSVLTDYALKRVITVDDSKKTFVNLSLYAEAEQRYAEAYNRRFLRQMLTKIGVNTAPPDMRNPFWAQQELGVADPADGAVDIASAPVKGGGTKFTSAGEDVASFTPSDTSLSSAERAGFSRFLYGNVSLHPQIIEAVLASNAIPKELSYVTMGGGKRKSVRWTLSSVSRLTAIYPLEAGFANRLPDEDPSDPDGRAVASVLPVMLAAVSGKAPGMNSLADYNSRIDNALKQGNQFQVFLTYLEMSLQYGKGAGICKPDQTEKCHPSSVLADAVKKDSRAATLVQALAVEKSDPAKAIAMEQGIDRAGVSNGYVIDDFLGNTMADANRGQDAIPLLSNAVRGNPYLGGYYKDFGDLFRKSFRADLAWLFYDLGRELPGGSGAPVISIINGYEGFLEKKVPQFF